MNDLLMFKQKSQPVSNTVSMRGMPFDKEKILSMESAATDFRKYS
ncbi:MAG TPA: hypothetical protein PKH80_04590 [Methanofastidiosum sp.]|nr:hypothetical protein [Methanofastidiosum sp.]HNU60885.1 hypothetical protein [Methanofastidiosum sp.]